MPAVGADARDPADAPVTSQTNFEPTSQTDRFDQMSDRCRAIWALRHLQVENGKFQSSDDDQARKSQVSTSMLYDDIVLKLDVAFEASDKIFITYDADNEAAESHR